MFSKNKHAKTRDIIDKIAPIELGPAFHSILGDVVPFYSAAACSDLEYTSSMNRVKLILIGCTSHLLLNMAVYP